MGRDAAGKRVSLNSLWFRRQSTKFNGVPYVIQRAAAAVYTDAGRREVRSAIDFYMENARIIRQGRSEEHTSELQSQSNLVCRLLLEKKKKKKNHDKHESALT